MATERVHERGRAPATVARYAAALSCAVALACAGETPRPTSDGPASAWLTAPDSVTFLSQTGLYADLARDVIAAGMLSFEPRFPLWSDGSDKRRWLRLPPGTRIDNTQPDEWQLPPGAVAFKEFGRNGTRLETRVIARTGPGPRDYWLGAFLWNEEQTDARLVPEGASDVLGTSHDVPSRKRCGTCHDGAPGKVLGLSAVQQPQLPADWLQAPGAAASPPQEPARAALGYLHANCSHCHNPRGSAFPDTDLDLRASHLDVSAAATRAERTTLRVPLQFFRRGGAQWRVLPGVPEQSALLQRMSSDDPLVRMPPLGSERVDAAGVALVREWIASLPR